MESSPRIEKVRQIRVANPFSPSFMGESFLASWLPDSSPPQAQLALGFRFWTMDGTPSNTAKRNPHMTALWWTLIILLIVVGLIGTVVPLLPGTTLILAGAV